jgi:phospholipid/cholesterol/gamma-HCH transport system permease protein
MTLAAPVREAGATLLLLGRALTRRGPRGAFHRQLVDLFLNTVPLNLASMAFVGAVIIVDGGRQVEHLFGDPGGIGPAVLQIVVREFGPAFGGVIAATRIGAGIAAEIAAMNVSEQIDALQLCSVDPVAELIAPRTRAAVVALFGLGAISVLSAAWTGAFTAAWTFGSRPGAFLDTSLLDRGDFLVAGAKCLAFGLAIPAIAARAGMVATGGTPAVGGATTRGVVYSIVAVVALDLIIGGAALAAGI